MCIHIDNTGYIMNRRDMHELPLDISTHEHSGKYGSGIYLNYINIAVTNKRVGILLLRLI